MPDDGSSPKTSRLEKSDQPKKGLEVGEFADLARREYQNLKKEDLEAKEPAALYQEAADFVKNAIGEVTSKFREIESGFKKSGDLPEKISTAVAGGLTLLSMGKKIFETAVGKITEIGNWLGEKLGQVAQKSLNRVLDIVLGNKELSKLLSKKLKGKIDYAELFRVWMQDGNKGVGKFLLEKVQAGEIEVEKEDWEKFSKAFDLPALPNLDKGKEIIDEAVEGGKEAAKELADQLEKAMGLEKFRGDFLKFVSEKCPAVAPQAQKWLDNMTAAHIIEIAKEDGFTEDQIITLWLPKIMSEGGPYALLRRVSGKDMPEGGVPGIVYFFLNASNKQEAIGMGVKALPEALDEFKPIISGVINEVTKNPGDAAGFFENLLDMNTITSTLFGGLKEDVHLATEAVNSSWWMKGYVKEILAVMFGSYIAYKGKLAGLILDKPFVALYLGGVTRYAWLKKKTLVDKIIDIICDRDGKEGKTSYRKSLYKLLQIEDKEEGEKELDAGEREKVDELLESEERGLIELWVEDKLDLEADENLTGLEKREAEILKTFTIDPLAAGGRVAKDMFEVVMKGFAAVGWDDAGNMLILGKNANPLYVMGKSFTQDVWHLLEGFAGEEDKGIIAPLGGLIIFGIGTHAVFDSYRQMLEEAPRMGYKAKHLLRSLLPFSKEWRYLAWSGLEGYAAPVMKLFQKNKLARIDSYFDELEEAIQSKDGQRVKKICESIKKVAAFEANEVVYRKLSKTRIAWQFNQMIDSIFEQVDKIRAFGTDLDDPEVQKKLQNWLGKAKGELAQTRTVVLNYLTRMNMILGGHPIQAIMKEFPDTSGITQIDAKKFFSGTPQEMSQRISELEGKLSTASVSELERAKASQELLSLKSYLKPESAVEEVAKRVDDLERGLGQISNPEQLKESLERMATDLRAMEEGIQARFVAKVKEARALAEAEDLPLNHPKIQEMLNKIDQEIGIPFAETKMKLVSLLDQGLKMLPKSLRSATLKHKLWRAIEGTEGTFLTRLSQSAGGRAKMMVAMAALMFVTDQLVHRGDPERDLEQIWEELGPDLRQLLLDVLPIAGTYSNFHSAISGKEIISDRDVSSLPDRLSNTAWGVAGLAGDIVTVIGFLPSAGTSTGANIGIRLAKSGAKGQRLMKFLPRLEAVADKMGGYWELAKSLRRIKQAEKTAHAIRALKTIERTAIGSGLVMLGGQIATMVYGFTEGDIEAIDPANYDQESIQGQE